MNKLVEVVFLKGLITFLRGAFVGGTMTVPGVSGGTMAIIIGVYEKLLYSINNIRRNPKESIKFLIGFSAGGIVGFLLLARLVTSLIDNNTTGAFMRFLFSGIVLGGIPLLVKKSGMKKITLGNVSFMLLGATVVIALSLLPEGSFLSDNFLMNIILRFIGGVIVAIALILPGISATHMLYVLGLYSEVLELVYSFKFLELIPLAAGGIIGILLTAKGIEKLIEKYTLSIYMVIIGFVAGSLVSLLKGVMVENVLAYFMFIPGFLIMHFVSKRVEE